MSDNVRSLYGTVLLAILHPRRRYNGYAADHRAHSGYGTDGCGPLLWRRPQGSWRPVMKKTRLLLVDDHDVVRRGIAAILTGRADWELCGEAATGREAVAEAAHLKPDVVVMDISMPEMNGLDATRQILQNRPETEVLILSAYESSKLVRAVVDSGARGYLSKRDAPCDLVAALEAVRCHKPYFTTHPVALRRSLPQQPEAGTGGGHISPREREIVELVARGKSTKEIAALLKISTKTVETHRARIMAKLNVRSVCELVRYAVRNQMIES
jgi:DNA-binding NarL/FixJ family response regulator